MTENEILETLHAAGYRLSVAEEDGHPGAIVDRRGGR